MSRNPIIHADIPVFHYPDVERCDECEETAPFPTYDPQQDEVTVTNFTGVRIAGRYRDGIVVEYNFGEEGYEVTIRQCDDMVVLSYEEAEALCDALSQALADII